MELIVLIVVGVFLTVAYRFLKGVIGALTGRF